MFHTRHSRNAMITAPHHLAAEAGADILRAGGNAVEAMVAAAATIAVVYPHMNSLGGDGFWIISEPGKAPFGIDASGPAAALATLETYRESGFSAIPPRGPKAALSVAGALDGWACALTAARHWGKQLPLRDLLANAISQARDGIHLSASQADLTREKLAELKAVSGFAETYLDPAGHVIPAGGILKQGALASTLEHLATAGLDDFYRGDVARTLAKGFADNDGVLRLEDFESYHALRVKPLSLRLRCARLYNMPAPSQGVTSLMILGLFERLRVEHGDTFAHIHALVEATKRAFTLRDAYLTDPAFMDRDPSAWLKADVLETEARKIDMEHAAPWPHIANPGDTVWMGAADREGRVVSFIQSLYWEYGSAFVPPATGVVWQNRGVSFSLDPDHPNALAPRKRPLHTLNPALAHLDDGRTLAYGTMGGDGQPQTQAAIFTRHVLFDHPLQQAITAPRWLLGRTWGDDATNLKRAVLKLENRFDTTIVKQLIAAGHDVEVVAPFSPLMGHAGMLSVGTNRQGSPMHFKGASDPRSDGAAVGL